MKQQPDEPTPEAPDHEWEEFELTLAARTRARKSAIENGWLSSAGDKTPDSHREQDAAFPFNLCSPPRTRTSDLHASRTGKVTLSADTAVAAVGVTRVSPRPTEKARDRGRWVASRPSLGRISPASPRQTEINDGN